MSADLTVSLVELRRLGSELGKIADVLDGRSATVRIDPGDLGHRDVARALDTFADKWDDKRELLTRALRGVGAMAWQSADVFAQADDDLAARAASILRGAGP